MEIVSKRKKIGILGAMPQEIQLIKEQMTVCQETVLADRIYYEGELAGQEIVLVFSRWGKVAASSTVTTLIAIFNVTHVLFIGVAGSVKKHVKIGDVVISTGLYQHDMNSEPFFQQFEIPLTGSIVFRPDENLINIAEKAVMYFLENVDRELLSQHGVDTPQFYKGIIASGDRFVQTAATDESLQGNFDALSVEMEGAAVAQVCSEHDVPFIVIRTISDSADDEAAEDCQTFADTIASYYSVGIVHHMLGNL